MTGKKPSAVETLASWVNGAARDLGQRDVLRKIVRQAAEDAASVYEDEDAYGVRGVIAKFAAALDQDEVDRKQDGM